MADPIFDPITGPKWVLDGRVVPMTGQGDIIDNGRIYIDGGIIAAVQPAKVAPPDGFEGIRPIKTGGTVFPGMIELHNHLPYNVLPLWKVPKQYDNRDQWGRHRDYRRLISGPMNVLGRTDGLIQAVVRWVEAKALISGTTTSQGIALFSNSGIRKYYRGLVRNAEETNDPALPEAATRIGDVEAKSAARFLSRLETYKDKHKKLILHLAEGRDNRANDHFRALKIGRGKWAINEALIGIHCTGLRNRNFETLSVRGGSVVWSPLSNLLLYGATTDISRAREEELLISLGSDWSPSGSKNLLMELKVARHYCDSAGIPLSNYELAEMVTRNPATMLGWGDELGTIEAGKRADFMVISGKSRDPYDRLLAAKETSVSLVVINGVRRYGQPRLMRDIDGLEDYVIDESARSFNLHQENVEQSVAGLSIAESEARLRDAFARLPELARHLEQGTVTSLASASGKPEVTRPGAGGQFANIAGNWVLGLDHADDATDAHRPKLTLEGIRTGEFGPSEAAATQLSELLQPIELDPLAAQDDGQFWTTMARQASLPPQVRDGLFAGYSRSAPAAPPPTSLAAAEEALPQVSSEDMLSVENRIELVDQAIAMLDLTYAHLPLKRSLHAVDPIQRLRLLKYRLTEEQRTTSDVQFHAEMTDIFNSMRDLHTNYLLPSPYRRFTAVLPFQLEECFEKKDDGSFEHHYVVSKIAPGRDHPTFTAGVEVLNWNGVPIRRAIERNASRQAGSNDDASFARGLDAMTVRPLITTVPPDEEWVTITYRTTDDDVHQVRTEWQLVQSGQESSADIEDAVQAGLGIDLQTSAVGLARKNLYARQAADAEEEAGTQFVEEAVAIADDQLETHMPGIFRVKRVGDGQYGYIRIFSFAVRDVDAFVDEFARLVEMMPSEGLIIDVRGNGGGAIGAAERILQLLTPREIKPSRAQFTTSPLLLDLCRRHAPSEQIRGLDLSPWVDSLKQAVATGSVYSRGFPITSPEAANDRGQRYHGPVVLIVDALSYSATDILAAGFIDHSIGKVLGTAGNMGAGGANVWRHRDLVLLAGDDAELKPLPGDTGMRVSVRRITRVGEAEGEVLEDLGIRIKNRHHMTNDDITGGNEDMIRAAIDLLKTQPMHRFDVTVARRARGRLRVVADTDGIETVEVWVAGSAIGSFAATLEAQTFAGLPGEQVEVELVGRASGEVVARRREHV